MTAEPLEHSLVFADTKLQTLDRRVGSRNLLFHKELFEQSLDEWEGKPVIYSRSGIHPEDFDAVSEDPKEAAKAAGGKLVGYVTNPHIIVEGGARLMATLVINDEESEIAREWKDGKLVPSTAFLAQADGDEMLTPPVPNHVLIFPYDVDRVLPGDPGAYVNSIEVKEMTEENVPAVPLAEEETAPAVPEEVPVEAAAPDRRDEEIAALKAELEAYRTREMNSRFERILQSVPVGMKQTESQIAELRSRFDTDPVQLLMSVLEYKPKKAETESAGVPYTFSLEQNPYTTVGDLSGRRA